MLTCLALAAAQHGGVSAELGRKVPPEGRCVVPPAATAAAWAILLQLSALTLTPGLHLWLPPLGNTM